MRRRRSMLELCEVYSKFKLSEYPNNFPPSPSTIRMKIRETSRDAEYDLLQKLLFQHKENKAQRFDGVP